MKKVWEFIKELCKYFWDLFEWAFILLSLVLCVFNLYLTITSPEDSRDRTIIYALRHHADIVRDEQEVLDWDLIKNAHYDEEKNILYIEYE